jgi:DNA-binding transcriptional MerR regulator
VESRLLEQKHLEEIKEIKNLASLEREQLNNSNQVLEKTLSDQTEQINKLNSKITTLQKVFIFNLTLLLAYYFKVFS